MIKSLLFGAWVCCVALASLSASLWLFADTVSSAPAEVKGEVFKLDSINVPVVKGASVSGYVIAQLSFVIDAQEAKRLPMPLDVFVAGETFAFLFDESNREPLMRGRLAQGMDALRAAINGRSGAGLILAVEVKQLDFIDKREIRDRDARQVTAAH